MPAVYWFRVRFFISRRTQVIEAASATERALLQIALTPYAELLDEGLSSAPGMVQ